MLLTKQDFRCVNVSNDSLPWYAPIPDIPTPPNGNDSTANVFFYLINLKPKNKCLNCKNNTTILGNNRDWWQIMCFESKVFILINVSISVVAFLSFLPTYCITVSLMHMPPALVSLQNKSWIFESDVNAYKTKGVSLKYKKKIECHFHVLWMKIQHQSDEDEFRGVFSTTRSINLV